MKQERRRVWGLARGLHRRLLRWFTLAGLVGVVAGAVGAHAWRDGASLGVLLIGAVAAVVVWGPLSWAATFRLARPLRELARVAADLRRGRLEQRSALPDADGEVGEVAAALGGMADRVAQQLADQRALMAAVSHELRSPLARTRVMVEMAREGSAPPTWLDDVEEEIVSMDRLVGDLLAAARIDFEAVSPRPLDPADVGRRALEAARLGADLLVTDGAPSTVRADATLLVRALMLLLDNASRHGGRAVALRIGAEGGGVRFVVEDDGPGFADGDAQRAFAPFWRGAGARASGVGLGLALVQQIAEAHGGRAEAGNRPEGGAWVALVVPL